MSVLLVPPSEDYKFPEQPMLSIANSTWREMTSRVPGLSWNGLNEPQCYSSRELILIAKANESIVPDFSKILLDLAYEGGAILS